MPFSGTDIGEDHPFSCAFVRQVWVGRSSVLLSCREKMCSRCANTPGTYLPSSHLQELRVRKSRGLDGFIAK